MLNKLRTLTVSGAAALLCAFAAPAAANNGDTLIIDNTEASPLGESSEEFRTLFSDWQSEDEPEAATDVQMVGVSVPNGMPVLDGRMSSSYGMRNHPVLRRRANHKGVDLAASSGTPIYATADGIVERANRFSSYGLYIAIDHGSDMQTRFAHLSRLAVRAGDQVRKGDLIGYVGSTGRSTGPHLHYEIRIAGVAVDPRPYMIDSAPTQVRVASAGGAVRGAE